MDSAIDPDSMIFVEYPGNRMAGMQLKYQKSVITEAAYLLFGKNVHYSFIRLIIIILYYIIIIIINIKCCKFIALDLYNLNGFFTFNKLICT